MVDRDRWGYPWQVDPLLGSGFKGEELDLNGDLMMMRWRDKGNYTEERYVRKC